MYVQPDALQRVCEEIERVVWPIDRAFFESHPQREYWVRPAEDIEVSERELMDGFPAPPMPPGWSAYVAVNALAPGVRMRLPFLAPDMGTSWRDLSEGDCSYQFHNCLVRNWEGAVLKADHDHCPGELHP